MFTRHLRGLISRHIGSSFRAFTYQPHYFAGLTFAVACLFWLTSAQCFSADAPVSSDSSTKMSQLYSPFDESRPRIPPEIISDKRLDQRITVCVRNKNMRDLLWEIRGLTGVRLVVARELAGERPIIYFRDRPLRDLMTEISGLYGYYWLVSGKNGSWTYELFEDDVHSKRRDLVRDKQDSDKVESLLDCVEMVHKAIGTDGGLEHIRQVNPRLYQSVSDPGHIELIKVLGSMDRATLRSLLNDIGMVKSYNDLPSTMQSGILSTFNVTLENRKADPQTNGESISKPWKADELISSMVTIKRWRRTVFSAPHFVLKVSVPAKEGQAARPFVLLWPDSDPTEPDMLNLPTTLPGRVIGDPLPSTPGISIQRSRKLLYDGRIVLGDVLESIAKQASVDIIADYYFQESTANEHVNEPLDKLVSDVCSSMDYTCQVEQNTLRFRFDQWFLQPLADEPPSRLQELWWKRITDTGNLSLDDLLDIACLPGQQTWWSGFRTIPQAWQARRFPRTARVVRMLGPVLEGLACSSEGLPVSRLNTEQYNRIADWASVMGVKETEDLTRSVIKIEKSGEPVNSLRFMLVLPGGQTRDVVMSAELQPLDEEQRRLLADERKKELSADEIRLSTTSEK